MQIEITENTIEMFQRAIDRAFEKEKPKLPSKVYYKLSSPFENIINSVNAINQIIDYLKAKEKQMNNLSKEAFMSKKQIDVYVVLSWYWEGDSNLVNSFISCRTNLEEAVLDPEKTNTSHGVTFKPVVLMPGEKTEAEIEQTNGSYGDQDFYEIRKITLQVEEK